MLCGEVSDVMVCFGCPVNIASTSIWIQRIHPSKSNALTWNVPNSVPNMCSPEFWFPVIRWGGSFLTILSMFHLYCIWGWGTHVNQHAPGIVNTDVATISCLNNQCEHQHHTSPLLKYVKTGRDICHIHSCHLLHIDTIMLVWDIHIVIHENNTLIIDHTCSSMCRYILPPGKSWHKYKSCLNKATTMAPDP